jgi:hypothetical protein
MDDSPRLVIGAYHDAVGAGHSDLAPEFKASLTVHIPLQDPGLVGNVVAFSGHIPMGDSL